MPGGDGLRGLEPVPREVRKPGRERAPGSCGDDPGQWSRSCGGACHVKDYRPHRIATLFGQVSARLPRFRCIACGGIESGVDWPSHGRSTPELERLQAHLSALMSYRTAADVLAQNAATIRTLAEELYKRLGVFSSHLTKLGRNLATRVETFNSAVGSLEHQVLPGARKFTELGVRPEREIEALEPVDKLTREPQWSEDYDLFAGVPEPESNSKQSDESQG